jgi:hypothetical protein
MDLQCRREPDGTWTVRVLSRIGGHGLHGGFTSPQDALRWVADAILPSRIEQPSDRVSHADFIVTPMRDPESLPGRQIVRELED